MFNLGMGEITVILLLALIFLGPAKLPDLASGLGKLIREIRKATSDVKNEIALDETFRKPFEDLRDAVTLHPDELKRRDQWAKEREEAAKRAAEEAAKYAAENPSGVTPPDGLANPVVPGGVIHPPPPSKLPEPNGPNATIVQPAPPRGATLEDIPTPPPEVVPAVKPPGLPPSGTVARPETLRGVKPVPSAAAAPAAAAPAAAAPAAAAPAAAAPAAATPAAATPGAVAAAAPVAAPIEATFGPPLFPTATTGGGATAPTPPAAKNGENITQILKEEDLIPSSSSGAPPPPPHLPGLRPIAPRPAVAPPPPPLPADKKKP